MTKRKLVFLSSLLISTVLIYLSKRGLFNSAIGIAVFMMLFLLGIPIAWQIKEYIKNKYPQTVIPKRCHFCGFELSEDATHCHNCAKPLDDEIVDKFEEDMKEKKVCPYCGRKELETVYEISRGYREVCASCGKSRVSRRAIRMTFVVIAFCIAYVVLLLLSGLTIKR
jgi:hypothetical protein